MDTGFASGVADLDALADLSVGHAHEVVRLESVAEEAVKESGDYATAFARILDGRAKTAIATKSILAYRGGFDGDLSEPTPAEVAEAAIRWRDSGGPPADRPGAAAVRAPSGSAPGQAAAVSRRVRRPRLRPAQDESASSAGLSAQAAATPRSCCCTAIPTNARPAIWRRRSTTSISTAGCPSTTSARARRRSSDGCWRWRRSARSCTRRTGSVRPNCTISEPGCGATESGDTLQEFVDAGEWSEADAIRVVDLIARENAQRIYALA